MTITKVRLERDIKFKTNPRTILEGSIFKLNVKNGYFELKIRNDVIASVSQDTIDKNSSLFDKIEE